MSKQPAWMVEILRLLREGPRTRDELVAKAGPLIPAGRAARNHQVHRDWLRMKRGYARRNEVAVSLAIEYGRRAIIARTLYYLKSRGVISVDESPGDRGRDRFQLV